MAIKCSHIPKVIAHSPAGTKNPVLTTSCMGGMGIFNTFKRETASSKPLTGVDYKSTHCDDSEEN